MAWLSQPAQASDLPASSDSVPWDKLCEFSQSDEREKELKTHWTVFWGIRRNRLWIWDYRRRLDYNHCDEGERVK